jgi:amino acid adenylation domain-containing protein
MPAQSTVGLKARPVSKRRLCVPHLVQAAAAREPGAPALIADGARLTYADLDRESNRLAAYLHSLGVGPEIAVAICLDRSFDFVIAALAVWKAGGAYLPLDPSWPVERRQSIIQDAQARALITRTEFVCRARYVVDLSLDAPMIAREPAAFTPHPLRREHLACILYSFGSNGEATGVEVTHGNLLNLIFWHRRAFSITAADRATHLSGVAFGAAVWELWPYLTAGAVIAIPSEDIRTSPDLLRDWLAAQSITISFLPAALAEPLIASGWPRATALRYLLSGGETLQRYPAASLPFQVINNYGRTECTVVATSGEIRPDPAPSLPHIGTPIANAQIYLLDAAQRRVPRGEIGEIYIAGTGVARGYRNRPDLTAQRFMEDPFAISETARMYRTGDLARMLPDGRIAFCGRVVTGKIVRASRSSSPIEKKVAAMLCELLHLDRVWMVDNSFLIRGPSLLAARLMLRVRERFGVDLTLRDIFEAPTVAGLSAEIERRILARLDSMSEEQAARLLALDAGVSSK